MVPNGPKQPHWDVLNVQPCFNFSDEIIILNRFITCSSQHEIEVKSTCAPCSLVLSCSETCFCCNK